MSCNIRFNKYIFISDLSLFYCDRFSEVARAVDVAALHDGHVVREELHGDYAEEALEAVHRPGHLQTDRLTNH